MGKAFIDDVREFHERFGVPILDAPKMPTEERQRLRRSLILEEAIETCEAIERGDIIEAADGIADLIYVALGSALEFGIPIERVWAEVHRSNMEKIGGATREDGKILKPPGWVRPDIAGALGLSEDSIR